MEAIQRYQACSQRPSFSQKVSRGDGLKWYCPSLSVKFHHLGHGKTKLDPCSYGTSLRNTSNFTRTQPTHNVPRMEAFQWCQTCHSNRKFEWRWTDIKLQRPSSSQKISRGESLKCHLQHLGIGPKAKQNFYILVKSKWHLQIWLHIWTVFCLSLFVSFPRNLYHDQILLYTFNHTSGSVQSF